MTLDEYHAAYRLNRMYFNLTELLKSTSTYAQQDDHEVFNNYDGQSVDASRYAAGIGAFLNYMPIRESGLLDDPTCAGSPLFRVFHWGAMADVIILDERSCRSRDVAVACAGDLAPSIRNVVFLATDTHATIVNEVFRDRFENGFPAAPTTIAHEVVTGPIAFFTFAQQISSALGPAAVAQLQAALSLAGVDCRNLDKNSYGVVQVDAFLGTATAEFKDQNGAPVLNQVAPFVPCKKTLGP